MNFMNIYALPKKLLVFILITAGVAIVVLKDPPLTVCGVQVENYKSDNINFLFPDPKKKTNSKSKLDTFYKKALTECRENNSPGGCYSLFSSVDRLMKSFRQIDSKCYPQVSQLKEVKDVLFQIHSLFIEISWAEGPKDELSSPLSWLSLNDVSTFCKVKDKILYFYGRDTLKSLEEKVMNQIGSDYTREKVIRFSILSENCHLHPR